MNPFPVDVYNSLPFERNEEPITLGIPFARGALREASALAVQTSKGTPLPCQAAAQTTWGDGSVRWALLRFIGDLPPAGSARFRVGTNKPPAKASAGAPAGAKTPRPVLKCLHDTSRVEIDTGALRFSLDAGTFRGFEHVQIRMPDGKSWDLVATPTPIGSLYLIDKDGKTYTALWGKVRNFEVEENGPLTARIRLEGELADQSGHGIAEYDLWIEVWAGERSIRTWLTLRNSRAVTRRVLGQWSLGQPGSIYFKEAGWKLLAAQSGVSYATLHGGPETASA